MDELTNHACYDEPKSLDYKFEDVFQEMLGGMLPTEVNLISASIQNQWLQRNPSTAYACTCFGLSHNIDIEAQSDITKGEDLWAQALQRWASLTEGWYLQKALDMGRELGYVIWYSIVSWLNQIKTALNNSQVIYTGSNQIDWKATISNGNIVIVGNSYGHCFTIQGYDDTKQLLICRNSYWPDYMDNGLFYIRYSDIWCLFTTYAVTDKQNAQTILNFKQKLMEQNTQRLIDLWITNGQNPDLNVTRWEIFIMLGHLVQLMETKYWKLQ